MSEARTQTGAAWVAWGLAAVSVAATVAMWVGLARGGDAAQDALDESLIGLVSVVSAGVAAVIVSRQPRNTIGWLLMTQGVGQALAGPVVVYLGGLTTTPAQPGGLLIAALWFENVSWLFLIFSLFFIPLLFPTGRPLSRRWYGVIGLGIGMCLLLMTAAAFSRVLGPLEADWRVRNPIGFVPETWIEPILVPWAFGLATLTVAALAAVVMRYRRGNPVERQQIKWLVFGCAVFAAVYASSLGSVWAGSDGADWDFDRVWNVLFTAALMAIPVSIAIAILRYRLWDIDVIIRRTLIYSVLSAVLALAYLGSVVVLQEVLRLLTGQANSPVVVVVSTLAIAALFGPVRARVQAAIDRRFYRQKYDAARTLAAFGTALRDETDLARLSGRLVGVVEETMQPAQVSLWLRRPK